MAEDFRHRYDKWSKNNLIIEIERLKRKVQQLEGLDPASLEVIRGRTKREAELEAKRRAAAMEKVDRLPEPARQLEEHELVAKDIGGGIIVMVPPEME